MLRSLMRNTLERMPKAINFIRNSRDLLDRNSPPIKTPWGFTFAGDEAMAQGIFEPEETAIVCKLLQDVDLLVNVGANIGFYCCQALRLDKSVIAVEPIPRNLYYLLKNIKNNGWANKAEVFPVALGSQVDILSMWGGNTGASLIKGWASNPESYVTVVPVLTLDRLLSDSLKGKQALILVDIEGAEYMMLQGASKILQNDPPPIWMIEISTTENQPAGALNPYLLKTFDLFFNNGYEAVTADSVGRKIDRTDINAVINEGASVPTYNFIFSKKINNEE